MTLEGPVQLSFLPMFEEFIFQNLESQNLVLGGLF